MAMELEDLKRQLAQAQAREHQLGETRRAVVNLLEDLDDDRQRLTRAEHEWRAAFDGIRDAIFMHDTQGRITRINRAYRALAGQDAEQALGRPYWEVFPPLPGPLPGCRPVHEHELEVRGSVFRSRAFVTHDDEGNYLFCLHILEDITERRRAELVLRRRSEELAQANRALTQAIEDLTNAERVLVQAEKLAAIGTLASGVAHELNNPLMGVMNYVSYAREKSTDARSRDALTKATRELQRMADFVHNLLVLGRPAGEVLVPVQVQVALERALDLLAADVRKLKVAIRVALPEDLPRVWGTLAPLEQVFINLLLNAFNALENAPVREVCVEGGAEADRVWVSVTDTGRGVPPEARDRLFDPFFSTKAEGHGTGLGLPTSQRIMQGFGGDLVFDPDHHPGARFVLTFRPARFGSDNGTDVSVP
ncbi:MAG: ATP-binding protein [Gammaproteobacteria bacterium]|nr:ATP-binding protein [Gammaproteobacteria bacterium]